MSQNTTQEFGKIRGFFWPIFAYELKKFLPMFFMIFCISFNYTILRDTKDTLIVTASGSGAEAIPFLKVWGTVPSAVLFMVLFTWLSNKLSKEKLFYAAITPFLVFFAAFALFLYPNREILHPHAHADYLETILSPGLKGLIACYRNWTFSVFYIMAELWGSVCLSLLFWGFANQIVRVSEAKRFYSMFILGANIALLISGPTIVYFSRLRMRLPADVDAWGITLNYLMGTVVLLGASVVATYWWMNRNILTDPRFYDPKDVKKKKKKVKMGMLESFKFLASSKYILCLATLVVGYGISINIVEVTWKSQLKLQYPDPSAYSEFMGYFSTATGFATIIMLFIGGWIIRNTNWGFAASITPIILLATGASFFTFVIFRDSLGGPIAALGTTPLFLAVLIGMVQNILTKSSKYALFDPTKEMAYIPLDDETKTKGKAAIDVVGARLGKSGGALLQQGLLVILGSIHLMTPYIAAILFLIIGGWLVAVRTLNVEFNKLTGKSSTKTEDSAPSDAEPALAKVKA